MSLRGGNALWGNTTHSHDACLAEISKYGKLRNKEDICKTLEDYSTDDKKVGGCNQQLFRMYGGEIVGWLFTIYSKIGLYCECKKHTSTICKVVHCAKPNQCVQYISCCRVRVLGIRIRVAIFLHPTLVVQ